MGLQLTVRSYTLAARLTEDWSVFVPFWFNRPICLLTTEFPIQVASVLKTFKNSCPTPCPIDLYELFLPYHDPGKEIAGVYKWCMYSIYQNSSESAGYFSATDWFMNHLTLSSFDSLISLPRGIRGLKWVNIVTIPRYHIRDLIESMLSIEKVYIQLLQLLMAHLRLFHRPHVHRYHITHTGHSVE